MLKDFYYYLIGISAAPDIWILFKILKNSLQASIFILFKSLVPVLHFKDLTEN